MNDRLTKNDIKKMEEEIEHRKLVVRKEALEDVKEARAQGDLSENFEYKAAKRFKNQNESRIRYLEKMIKTAQIIEMIPKRTKWDLIKLLKSEFVEDGTVEKYRLVTTVRNNPLEGLISIESPIAKALMGHKAGDQVHVQVNDSFGYEVIIKSIENTPDDDSIEIRKF